MSTVYTFTDENGIIWNYTIIGTSPNQSASIGSGSGSGNATTLGTGISGAIIIPAIVGGYNVTKIGNQAFVSCSGISSIDIPDLVTSIGNIAFIGCSGLTSIALPDSLTSIGSNAFQNCTGLTSITLPDSLTSIGDSAFQSCTGASSITLPDSLTSIGVSVFQSCTGVSSITLPDSLTSIGSNAFYSCTSLRSINIPNSVTSIGDNAFYDCTGLTSIVIGTSATYIGTQTTSIGSNAFRNCTGVTSIMIGTSVTSISNNAFYNCRGAISITIGNNVESIGSSAFFGCDSVTSIMIPDLVESIGDNAFAGCDGLKSLTIGNNVTSIPLNAFNGCIRLTSIVLGNMVASIGDGAFYNCRDLTSIIIPDSVTSIGDAAFRDCTKLRSINIPDSVTSILNNAFTNTSINLIVAMNTKTFGTTTYESPTLAGSTINFFGRGGTKLVLPTPTMLITSPTFNTGSATNISPITLKFTSSKATANFINTDISFNNTPFSNTLNTSDNKVYTATIDNPVQGLNTISVPAGVYTDSSAPTTSNSASNIFTFTYDSDAPDMEISSSTVTNGSTTNVQSINLTFTSSQPTYNFFKEDISFNNGAFPYTLDGSGSVYNATIANPIEGVNTIYVPAGAFTDYAGNSNNVSNTFTFTFSSVPPMMDISSSTVANNAFTKFSPIILTFTSTKATTTFSNDDISFNNGAFLYPLTTSDNKIYNATIETPIQGLNTFYVPEGAYTDSANQNNTASNRFTFTYDITPPTMEISSSNVANNATTKNTSMVLRFIPSEAIYDFSYNDISFNNGTLSNLNTVIITDINELDEFNGIDTYYTATFSPNPQIQGEYTISVPVNKFADAAGNYNTTASTFTFTFDTNPPTMTIASTNGVISGSTTNKDSIELTFTSNEETNNFTRNNISFNNGALGELTNPTGDKKVYIATFTPNPQILGEYTISVDDGAFSDDAGNYNVDAATFTFIFDNSGPSMTIASTNGVTTGSTINNEFINLTFTPSKPIYDFSYNDISFNNGYFLPQSLGVSGSDYTATFYPNPLVQGLYTISVPANTFTDVLGNYNTAASFSFTFDSVRPTMTIASTTDGVTSNSTTNKASIELTFISSEPINDFDIGDISFNNGELSQITTISRSNYTAIFTPYQGVCSIYVHADRFFDDVGNYNVASNDSTPFTFTFDNNPPTITIASTTVGVTIGSKTNKAPIELTFTSSKAGTGFTRDHISFNNGQLSVLTTTDNIVYNATFTPIGDGICRINVDADKFTDSVGNYNIASNQSTPFTFTYDNTPPIMTISSTDVANSGTTNKSSIELTFTSTEPIYDFSYNDISFNNGTLGALTNLTGDKKVYYATFTPNTQILGVYTILVDEGAFTDDAGNNNVDAATFTFTFNNTSPTMTIASTTVTSGSTTKNSPIELTFTSNGAIYGFTRDDIIISNGKLSPLISSSENVYIATFTPDPNDNTGKTLCSIYVPADRFTDAVGNNNTASNGSIPFTFTFDTTPPTITIESTTNGVTSGSTTNKSSIELKFTSTEPINGFEKEDITFNNGTLGALTNPTGDKKVYIATFTPNQQYQGVYIIEVGANTFTDDAGNYNTAATPFTFTFDITPPTITIESTTVTTGSTTKNSLIELIFTSSEPTNNFTRNNITFNNGTLGALTNPTGDKKVYIATFEPNQQFQGVYTISVDDGTFSDDAGNYNVDAATFTFTFDNTPPTMTISSTTIANNATAKNASIELTFTSIEPINGFVERDIDVYNGTISNFQSTSETVYTATFTPQNQGLCTINVNANKFTDYVGNNNTASNTFIWTFDNRPPTITITSSTVANNATTSNTPIELTFTSSEPITGFTSDDISFNNNGELIEFAGSGSLYTARFTPQNQGKYIITVDVNKFTDNAVNSNIDAAAFTFTFDSSSPIMTIASTTVTSGSTTKNSPIELTFASSAPTDDFTSDDISFNNIGELTEFTGSGSLYTARFTPQNQGEYIINIYADKFTDALGNYNTASTPFSFTFDSSPPSMTIASTSVTSGSTTKNSPIVLTFIPSEPITGFTKEDISFNNGTLSALDVSGSGYIATFTPQNQGLCTINVDANKFTDVVGNNNIAATPFTFTFDNTPPTMTIESTTVANNATTKNSPIVLTFIPSEPIYDFSYNDISFNNGTLSALDVSGSGYTATFTPQNQGVCTINVGANKFIDAVGNSNIDATTFTFTFDSSPPTMTITSPMVETGLSTNNTSIELTFTSSEPINGFEEGDIVVTNGELTNFLARSATVYTAKFTPQIQGVCTINVGANKYTDSVGNSNTDATTFTFTFDSVRPTMTIESTTVANNATTNNTSIELSFTSTESTTNFEKNDISFDNGTLSNFRAISATHYMVTFTPENQGRCTINVDANKFTDAVGNSNTAATPFTFTFDSVRPRMNITSSTIANNAITNNTTIALTFTSSKATNNFERSAIISNNGTLSVLTGSGSVYTATFTPTGTGACTINVDANRFTDAIGNNNTASNTFTFTFDSVPPTMIITSSTVENGLSTNNASLELIFTSSEPITGFTKDDIRFDNGTLSNFLAISATVYKATFTLQNQGLYAINVDANKFTDAAGNSNVAAPPFTFTFDNTPPTMTITSTNVETGSTTNNASIELTFTPSKPITGFTKDDISFDNGTLSNFRAISATDYKATFTTQNQGVYTINVDANKFIDAAGNSNAAATPFTFTFDSVPTTMTITSTTTGVTSGSITNDATIALTFTSSKATNNFVLGDISVTNGTLTNFAGIGTDGVIYTATFTPTGTGACTIDVAEGAFTDAAGNANAAATRFNWSFGRTVSFDANTLTIVNNIGANATDLVLFVLPSGEEMSNINVTAFTGTGTIRYDLSSDGENVISGTFTGTGTNLLGTNILIASTNTRYILTLTSNASLTYTIVGTKRVDYGNVTPTALSFVNNNLIIQNSIVAGDIERVSFDINADSVLYSLEVTNLLNANSISYVLDISGGSTVSSGSFTQAGFNLLNGNVLEPNTYILTLTSSGTNTYSIIGILRINQNFDIDKFCGRKKGSCNNVGYNKLVTSTNNPSTSSKMRYSQILRTQRFKTVRTYKTQAPPINNERPLYLFATGQIFTR